MQVIGPSTRGMWPGSVAWVAWLIQQMQPGSPHARVAGEAFSMITGAGLSALELDRPPSGDAAGGSEEDAEDAAMDEDGGLPWPAAVQARAGMGAAPNG